MNQTTTVPKLDLAPKLNHPLSLWNPLDYLRLLYWVFFFPQAIRWYVTTFGIVQYDVDRRSTIKLLSILRQDKVQRDLVFQCLVLTTVVPVIGGVVAQVLGWDWKISALLIIYPILLLVFAARGTRRFGLAFGLANSVVFGLPLILVLYISLGTLLNLTEHTVSQMVQAIVSELDQSLANTMPQLDPEMIKQILDSDYIKQLDPETRGLWESCLAQTDTTAVRSCVSWLLVPFFVSQIVPSLIVLLQGISLLFLLSSMLILAGLALGSSFSMLGSSRGVVTLIVSGAVVGLLVGRTSSWAVDLMAIWKINVGNSMLIGTLVGLSSILVVVRLLDYLFIFPLACWAWGRTHGVSGTWLGSHMVWLPLPFIQARLQRWATIDWDRTVDNANALLTYTLQFVPVVRAINTALERMPKEQVMAAVSKLATNPSDWNLILFCSNSILDGIARLRPKSIAVCFEPQTQALFLSEAYGLKPKRVARLACSGFWFLHVESPHAATHAFALTYRLPNGEELYRIAYLLASARDCKELKTIAAFVDASRWLTSPPETPLRPDTLRTLSRLRCIALDAAVANESISKLNRAATISHALGQLTQLLDDVEQTCQHPEREIVQKIAEQWRDALGRAAAEIGQIVVEKPVENPYVIGNPVVGKQFVGRDEILQRLEELWSGAGQRPTVVLYGHRRMGKSSILQNLGHYRFGMDTVVAYFSMQRVGRVEHTGELLYDIAVALWRACEGPAFSEKTGFWSEPSLDDYQQNWYARFNRFLRELDAHRNGRRFILAIDEFELIEQLISDGKVERALMDYLRGIIQTEPWLILALAGLHTLNEMTSNYFEPLYASVVPVHVSFLNEASLRQVIANPSEDFPLDYDRAALDLIWRLTGGQPYLAQLIGHNLVRAFNQARFEQGQACEIKFAIEDVQAVINAPDFFEQGSYYFNGLWTQAKQPPAHQTGILRVLTPHRDGLPFADILAQTHLDESAARTALETMQQHDVVEESDGRWRYRVELMRRWVESK